MQVIEESNREYPQWVKDLIKQYEKDKQLPKTKTKEINAEKELEHIKDDLEAIILRPYSSRAKNVRAEIKLKYE